jgi:pimeloyl-ACP methyl ester carboxylesterase
VIDSSHINSLPHLLLLHGFFGCAHNWRACVEALSLHWTIHAPELPFFGLNHKEDRLGHLIRHLEELLRGGGIERVVVVGNSLGGQLAVNLALRQPGRVAGLVLAGSSGLYERNLTTRVQRHPPREWVRDRVREIFYDEVHVTDRQVDEVMALIEDRSKAIDILLLAKSIRAQRLREALPRIECPVSLIWGADDRITPPETAREFKALLRDAELHFISRCGHAPMIEHPGEFTRLVEVFLRRFREPYQSPFSPFGSFGLLNVG